MLLIADAAITLAWQEPISALVTMREQARLEGQLDDLTRLAAQKPGPPRPDGFRPRHGRAFGRIELPTLDRDYVMVEGTDTPTLRKGPAHYPETPLPGQGGTVAVAGHRTTYLAPFRTIDDLRRRDRIMLTMPYGRFVYRVEKTRIVRPEDTWVKRKVGHERLILTACHPLYSAEKRIVVFARLARSERL
ncbi:MAG: class E sortase [Gammaproteobacteria bacterium]